VTLRSRRDLGYSLHHERAGEPSRRVGSEDR
jgi:hypothetical protein